LTAKHLVVLIFTEDSRQTELFTGILEEAIKPRYPGILLSPRQRRPNENLKDVVRTELQNFLIKRRVQVSILLIVRDTDCREPNNLRTEIEKWLKPLRKKAAKKSIIFPKLVLGLPSPHIEKWYLVDIGFWGDKVKQTRDAPPLNKCERGFYKLKLEEMCQELPRRGTEYGKDLGRHLYQIPRSNLPQDLANFLKDLDGALRFLGSQ
jgi:hypothetical protein